MTVSIRHLNEMTEKFQSLREMTGNKSLHIITQFDW